MTEKKTFASWSAACAADFIEEWEGRRLVAYRCSAGVLTIGVGHTVGVKEGDTCTDAQADAWLLDDIRSTVRQLAPFVNVSVTKGQFVALVSLGFNVGARYVTHSCPRLMRALNSGDEEDCARQFLDITRAGGRVVEGLVRRRKAEAALFLGES